MYVVRPVLCYVFISLVRSLCRSVVIYLCMWFVNVFVRYVAVSFGLSLCMPLLFDVVLSLVNVFVPSRCSYLWMSWFPSIVRVSSCR